MMKVFNYFRLKVRNLGGGMINTLAICQHDFLYLDMNFYELADGSMLLS